MTMLILNQEKIMNLEQEYIAKFNFNLGKFSKHFNFEIVHDDGFTFLPYLSFEFKYKKYNICFNFAHYDNILIDFGQSIESDPLEMSEIFTLFSSIIDTFKGTLNQQPLLFAEYANAVNQLQIVEADKHSKISIKDLKSLILSNNTSDRIETIKSILTSFNTHTKNNFKLLYINSDFKFKNPDDIFYLNFEINSCKVIFEKNLYKFIFDKKNSYSFNFENAIIFLNYFYIPQEELKLLSKFDLNKKSIECLSEDKNSDDILKIEQLLLNNQIKNF